MKNINGNKLMLSIYTAMLVLLGLIYVSHKHFGLLSDYALLMGVEHLSSGLTIFLYILLAIPILLLLIAVFFYKKDNDHERLPLLITLGFTFTSIAMIASGNGFVEYHFSIFMMLALIAFFRSIRLITISTIIFALQHFVGYFLFPELLCGTSDYRFTLLMIHAVYLILTALANGILINYMNRTHEQSEAIRKEALNQYKEVVRGIESVSKSIFSVSSHVDYRVGESERASDRISNLSTDLYDGAQSLQDYVERNMEHIERLLEMTQHLNRGAEMVNESTATTANDAADGAALITTTEEQFSIVKKSVDYLETHISQFAKTVSQIGTFVSEITMIADQTNLLALNASIEAARAGDAGAGFAVVAGEVRKLANESEQSAENIQKLVSSIEEETGGIHREIEKCVHEVEQGAESMNVSKNIFDNITRAIRDVQTEMNQILQLTTDLTDGKQQMNDSMQEMNVFSEQCLQSSRDIATAAEVQHETAEKLTGVSSELQAESSQLEKLVKDIHEYEKNI